MNDLKIIDAHMHTWDLDKNRYPWLQENAREMWLGDFSPLKKSYLIDRYLDDIKGCNVTKCIHLQAQMSGEAHIETEWLQEAKERTGFPSGFIGFCDLSRDDAENVILRHMEYSAIRGIRQDLNWHKDPFYRFCDDPNLMQDRTWSKNFKLLQKNALSFDLQIYAAHQHEAAYQLIKLNEGTNFVLNHSGAPYDKSKEGMELWLKGIKKLSTLPNLYTKLSGFDMYDHNWTVESLAEPILQVVDCFGVDKCLFASNFPVSKLYRSYRELLDAHMAILSFLNQSEKEKIFHDNAANVYRL